MSCYLWKSYLEDDVDRFRRLLEGSSHISRPQAQRGITAAGGSNPGTKSGGSKLVLASSPQSLSLKNHKSTGWASAKSNNPAGLVLTRADVNSKDSHGTTILHRAASSTSRNAIAFALALIEHPLSDIYVQDLESGWTVLHRALYFGNITIARAVIERSVRDVLGTVTGVSSHHAEGIIRVKDREGYSPFDVYAASTTTTDLTNKDTTYDDADNLEGSDDAVDNSSGSDEDTPLVGAAPKYINVQGDELFTFGTNKNLTLGFGDEDDRHYPERISLKRPAHLLERFHREHKDRVRHRLGSHLGDESSLTSTQNPPKICSSLPAIVQNRLIFIQDVALSKLHSAILTTDPESNLYICGFGPGGRLGTGDETTRFSFVCIESGGLSTKKVMSVAIGQNHTLAVSREGEVFTWGTNTFGQLGYTLPVPSQKDQDPVQLTPRQIFGPLRKEIITGVAASRIHSVVFTQSSLFTFGKNEGQLGLVDSDARSLEVQIAPRKVAASLFTSPIQMVSAIDRATICLLENHEVWVFANYGYTKVNFPIPSFAADMPGSNASIRSKAPSQISKITSQGDAICAMSRRGDVYIMTVTQQAEPGPVATSTTNPTKIRNGLTSPQRIWSPKRDHMAVRDVSAGQDGSIIICTESGSVWRGMKRAKPRDTNTSMGQSKTKNYKFSRVPGLTRIIAVRGNAFGAYAAIRKDTDVTRSQIRVRKPTLWNDLSSIISINGFKVTEEDSDTENPRMRFWAPATSTDGSNPLKVTLLNSVNVEDDLRSYLSSIAGDPNSGYDVVICSTLSDVRIPAHQVMLSCRSKVLRNALVETSRTGSYILSDLLSLHKDETDKIQVMFYGLDFLTILNVVLYIYLDIVLDVWHYPHLSPKSAFRYRQARAELMKVAARLELRLEQAVRAMAKPTKCLFADMKRAITDPDFFYNGDVIVELAGQQVRMHSLLLCQRCPFFEGLFKGRAEGRWLSTRRDLSEGLSKVVRVDLKHIEPQIFNIILQHVYADTGEELFNEVVTADLDEFLDLVIEVTSVANELMLDRLSEVCQKVLGRYVNLRNACQLLNAVAPCSVTEFKDATLQYLSQNLEAILESHFLDELDGDLLLELDQVIRENQMASLPLVKSRRAEALLNERYPNIHATIVQDKQARIQCLAAKIRQLEDWARRRPSKDVSSAPQSPDLRGKSSTTDLMFDMDDDEAIPSTKNASTLNSRSHAPNEDDRPLANELASPSPRPEGMGVSYDHNCMTVTLEEGVDTRSPLTTIGTPRLPGMSDQPVPAGDLASTTPFTPSIPWKYSTVPATKPDLRDIMAQTSSSRPSNIALGLSAESRRGERGRRSLSKMSQKERKKQQLQQQQMEMLPASPILEESTPMAKSKSPWQVTPPATKVSLKDVLGPQQMNLSPSPRSQSSTRLNLRQTVANSGAAAHKSSTPATSPATSPATVPHRSVSTPDAPTRLTQNSSPSLASRPVAVVKSANPPPAVNRTISTPSSSLPLVQSIRHQPHPIPESSLQPSMADILSQQQAEKDVIRDAVAKRSLQDIQQEQAFQEWWDTESRRIREEEEVTRNRSERGIRARGGRKRGRGGREETERRRREKGEK